MTYFVGEYLTTLLKIEKLQEILLAYGLTNNTSVKNFGDGLINNTYLLENSNKYILQKINTAVFTKPNIIAQNIRNCANYLEINSKDYLFIVPILTLDQKEYFQKDGETWRLLPFIPNSISFNNLDEPEQAYQAAKAVGRFVAKTNGISLKDFGETIPSFHDLSFRYKEFEMALANGSKERIASQKNIIAQIIGLNHICETYEDIKANPLIPKRVQHHDTKINNILFDKNTAKSLCLCDLDTIMPGYFISDLGDMMRTYLSVANEETTDLDQVTVRPLFFKSVIDGYLSEMENILSDAEKQYIFYAGEFMIYMQALRFFTDYLNNDIYYNISYPDNNLNRTLNQLKLLSEYQKLK